MRWLRVRFTIRLMMVVVVIIALALATIMWLINGINQSLHEFYRPGGTLEQIHEQVGVGPAPTQGQGQSDETSRLSTPPNVLPADDK
jgi:cytochrome c-type biogenesis protein CcmE